MRKRTRTCIVCGTEYSYCSNCREHALKPSWMAIYHDGNCRQIMNIATEFMAGNITKAEAKEQIETCDLSNKKNFKESVLVAINEIFSAKKSSKADKETTKIED